MLAGERSVEPLDQLGHVGVNRLHQFDILLVVQFDHRAHVQAPDRSVRVVRRLRAVVRDDAVERGNELGEPARIDGGVLDEGDGLAQAGHAVEQRLARLAQLPRRGHRGRIGVACGRGGCDRFGQRREGPLELVGIVREVLDVEHGRRALAVRGGEQIHVSAVFGVPASQ